MSADRGYDSGSLKKVLWDNWQIRPIIGTRMMWRDEKAEPGHDPKKRITRPLDAGKADTIVYTERGEVRCICPRIGTERDLAFHGFEATKRNPQVPLSRGSLWVRLQGMEGLRGYR